MVWQSHVLRRAAQRASSAAFGPILDSSLDARRLQSSLRKVFAEQSQSRSDNLRQFPLQAAKARVAARRTPKAIREGRNIERRRMPHTRRLTQGPPKQAPLLHSWHHGRRNARKRLPPPHLPLHAGCRSGALGRRLFLPAGAGERSDLGALAAVHRFRDRGDHRRGRVLAQPSLDCLATLRRRAGGLGCAVSSSAGPAAQAIAGLVEPALGSASRLRVDPAGPSRRAIDLPRSARDLARAGEVDLLFVALLRRGSGFPFPLRRAAAPDRGSGALRPGGGIDRLRPRVGRGPLAVRFLLVRHPPASIFSHHIRQPQPPELAAHVDQHGGARTGADRRGSPARRALGACLRGERSGHLLLAVSRRHLFLHRRAGDLRVLALPRPPVADFCFSGEPADAGTRVRDHPRHVGGAFDQRLRCLGAHRR